MFASKSARLIDKPTRNPDNSPLYLQRKYAQSLLIGNKLTKSYFSLHDTTLRRKQEQGAGGADKGRTSKRRGNMSVRVVNRYEGDSSGVVEEERQKSTPAVPRISLKKQQVETPLTLTEFARTKSHYQSQRNKFKLLFRDTSHRKTLSQRKIQRLQSKIQDITAHNKYLQAMKPVIKPLISPEKIKSKGEIVGRQKITRLCKVLLKNVSFYFGMYLTEQKVGNMLRSFEGYNEVIHRVFFESKIRAKRLQKQQQLLDEFWSFRPVEIRPQFYGEQDLKLYNILQNYSLKMEKSYTDIKRSFSEYETTKLRNYQKQINNKLKINESKLLKTLEPQQNVLNFVTSRKRHNHDRRQSTMVKLESLGVNFNIGQRNRQLAIREKEKIIKLFKKQNN